MLAAGDSQTPRSREALAVLCEKYWQPLYGYVRRRGHPVEEAQDLTQEFFARLIEKGYLRGVKPGPAKFRSFLLTALKRFLADEWDRARAQKRGGGRLPISLDFLAAESRHSLEPSHDLTPDKLYEKEWALSLLDHALARLRTEHTNAGECEKFDALKGFLTGETAGVPYKQAAGELGMSEGAVKVAVRCTLCLIQVCG